MRATVWHGKRDVRVDQVPDPVIQEPTDAVIRITSTGLCGSDLHLYEVLTPFMTPGDILGHEPMGIVEETGSEVPGLSPGDRVVVPFQIACGSCAMCGDGLPTQCETTQVREHGMGAQLFGYTKLYGAVPGAQAEYLRVPQAQFGPIKVPHGPSDDRFVYLSDVLPTAWQAVRYAGVGAGSSVVVLGLGPIGTMACRVARHLGAAQVIGIDHVPDRLERARRDGFGVDRMSALHLAIALVRRGGTISISGVYGGMTDPMPMLTLFDKQIQIRMGQANVRRWSDEILPLLTDEDVLGVDAFATHHLRLDRAPEAYELFQKKADGVLKVLLHP
ncbi:alcohol dehydrogenase catalytic domain-containing protein [Streptomyces syringium]|uniref:alcohol dehydrogenase catalytic domain-containing protein n=1 Tax=Streptomyces syringium TaxID=76729 RepID=UPI0037D85A76